MSEMEAKVAESENMNGSEDISATFTPRKREGKVFVGGLPWDIKQEDILEYFQKLGSVKKVNLITDSSTGRSKGYAFVIFETERMMKNVLDVKEHILKGKRVDVKSAFRRNAEPPCLKLFVGGIDPSSTSENELQSYFSQFGEVDQVEMPYDKEKNQKRSFCFVSFLSPESVDEAIEVQKHQIGRKAIHISKAKSRAEIMNQSAEAGAMRTLAPTTPTHNMYNPYGMYQGAPESRSPRGGFIGRRGTRFPRHDFRPDAYNNHMMPHPGHLPRDPQFGFHPAVAQPPPYYYPTQVNAIPSMPASGAPSMDYRTNVMPSAVPPPANAKSDAQDQSTNSQSANQSTNLSSSNYTQQDSKDKPEQTSALTPQAAAQSYPFAQNNDAARAAMAAMNAAAASLHPYYQQMHHQQMQAGTGLTAPAIPGAQQSAMDPTGLHSVYGTRFPTTGSRTGVSQVQPRHPSYNPYGR